MYDLLPMGGHATSSYQFRPLSCILVSVPALLLSDLPRIQGREVIPRRPARPQPGTKQAAHRTAIPQIPDLRRHGTGPVPSAASCKAASSCPPPRSSAPSPRHVKSRNGNQPMDVTARVGPRPNTVNTQSTPPIGVDYAIDGLASGPLGLGEVEDVDRALGPLVPRVVRDYLEIRSADVGRLPLTPT